MATPSVDKTELERPYTFLLFKSLMGIQTAWIENDFGEALSQACKLVTFLPNDIKDVLWSDKEKIQKNMNDIYGLKTHNFYSTHLVRNREANAYAHKCLEPFVDKMVRLLDEKGWLERGALRPRYPDKKKLSVEAIEQ